MEYTVISQGNEYPIPDELIYKYNLEPGKRTPFTKLLIVNKRCLQCSNIECKIEKENEIGTDIKYS